jgi:hypothetical protein
LPVHIGRIVGALIGVGMLACILLLPFSDVMTGHGSSPETLWSIFISFVNSLGSLGSTHASSFLDLAFLYQIAAILLIVGCIVGVYPIGSGVLGVVGLSFATFGPYEAITNYGADPTNFGVGFYLLWLASIIQLVLGVWTWRSERRSQRIKEAGTIGIVEPASGRPVPKAGAEMWSRSGGGPTAARVCPTCGTSNPFNAVVCKKCASPL